MGVFVKICGLANAEDTAATLTLRPDAVGFVFWHGSKRHVVAAKVSEWLRGAPADILKVGVFVDASPDVVERTVREAGLDVAQLHGKEDPAAYAGRGFRVWKVAHAGIDDVDALQVASVDALLLDTYSPESRGGTGLVGDWDAARRFARRSAKPVLLAGGLTPLNVAEAIAIVRPWGADVSSGVEARPGAKDMAKVEAFISACRKA